MATVVDLNALGFQYPNSESWIVRDLSFSVAAGEFLSMVGGSGVGKSTILRLVAGLLEAQTGSLEVTGKSAEGRRRRGLVFQDGRLMPWRDVAHNVRLGLEGLNLSTDIVNQRIDEVLNLTGLSDFKDRWPHQLSGGQVQRVGIARALAVQPDILLMDEPFSAVDTITRQSLQQELVRIWQASGAAVLFITHDIEEAAYLSDRVIVLKGQPAEIVHERPIEIERPRQRNSEELFRLAADIATYL